MMLQMSSSVQARQRRRFELFNRMGGKFRVSILNVCNLNCFFCHNEAMENPRKAGHDPLTRVGPSRLSAETMLDIVGAYTRLGGRQVNITGGEPLAHPEIVSILGRIPKRGSRIVLNTNAVLAHRLLREPRIEAVDAIFASLHTTDGRIFQEDLGGRSVQKVMDNIVALKAHGYEVQINYSLGDYNKAEFEGVLDYALAHGLTLKAIAFVATHEAPRQDAGPWIEPTWLASTLVARGAVEVGVKEAFGGVTTTWAVGDGVVKIKNVAQGRLMTDFCGGCAHRGQCGEGIYGLRVGVDGLWKPCLLRRERFEPVLSGDDHEARILAIVDAMVGDWSRARFVAGVPT